MPATASARFLARTPLSRCSPASRVSSSAEVFHILSAFSESRTRVFFPPRRRAAPPALHFCSLLCHSPFQSKELLIRPKPSSICRASFTNRREERLNYGYRTANQVSATPSLTYLDYLSPLMTAPLCPHTASFSSSFAYNISLYPIVCVLPYSPRCLPLSCV